MNTSVRFRENQKLQREANLAQLAEVANRAHDGVMNAAREAVARALEAGRALIAAREICPKGTWTAWLAGHFGGSSSTAHDYMRVAAYVAEMGNDPQCVAGLHYHEVKRMLAGRSCSGRGNGRRASASKPSAPARLLPPSQPPHGGQASLTSQDQVRDAAKRIKAAATGDSFAPIVQLLEQVVAELRHLVRGGSDDARYARHLLQPLERIRGGVTARRWFWDWIKR